MTRSEILIVVYALMAGMFLAALDQTIVGTSMRTIADDLDGLSLQAWVTTGYMILSTISTPIYGKLCDIFSRRALFIIAIGIFLAGSLLAGFSTNMFELSAYRAVQGLGAGGLMAIPLAIMADIIAPRERARYQGYFIAVFGISSVIGPLAGGLFAGAPEIVGIAGWRWVFLINIPIGIVVLAFVLRYLHIPHHKRRPRIDWWGAATIVIALVPLLLVAQQGREWGWDSPAALACYVVSAAGIVGFIFAEKVMGPDALIPLGLFRSSTFSVATLLAFLAGFGSFGAMIVIPLYLQLVNGASPTEGGLLMLPMIAGVIFAAITSGRIVSRTGRYKIFPILGTFFLCVGFAVFTFATADKPLWFLVIGMIFTGLGIGSLMPTLTIACQSAVGPRDIGVASSSATFFRQVGGTLSTAVLFSILFSTLPGILQGIFRQPELVQQVAAVAAESGANANPANTKILALLNDPAALAASLDGDSAFLMHADPRLTAPFVEAFASASTLAFLVALMVGVAAFVLSFFLKAVPLREKSAHEEAMELDVAAQQAANETGSLIAPDTAPVAVQRPPARTN